MLLFILTLLVTCPFSSSKTNMSYDDKFQSIASATSAPAYVSSVLSPVKYEQQESSWPPTVTHNNWFILQPATNGAARVEGHMASSRTQPQHQITKMLASTLNNYAEHITQHHQQQQQYSLPQKQTPQAQQQPTHPLKYYTYDSVRNGNYDLPPKDVSNIEPYVLTISKQNHPLMPSSEGNNGEEGGSQNKSITHQWTTNGVRAVNIHNNPGHVYNENNKSDNKPQDKHNNGAANKRNSIVSQQQILPLFEWQDIESKTNSENIYSDNGNNAYIGKGPKVEYGESIINNSIENEGLTEVLVPIGNILDKVKQYCEMLKEIINKDDEDLVPTSALSTYTAGDTTQLAVEVQGQQTAADVAAIAHSITPTPTTTTTTLTIPRSNGIITPASASAPTTINTTNSATTTAKASAKSLTSAALFIGRGKKLKKKLKKLMLPLLLAYKLKFIALVPMLIGGLTLLVGTTGLAGFFFALFVTVMSLKGVGSGGSSGHKSIVINKEW